MSTNQLTAAQVLDYAVRTGRDNMPEALLALRESEMPELIAKADEIARRIPAAMDAGYLVSTEYGDYELTEKGAAYLAAA